MKTVFLGKTLSGPFTIPSGIVTCSAPIIQAFFDQIPEVGVLTTKSIGPTPRAGYREPILSQYSPGNFVNAVGLTNPGAERSAELMAELTIPEDRFLLISIFGGSVDEYVEVAKIMAPHGDGLELNLSCPHAKGLGMAMGQDPDLVKEIVAAVKAAVDIPVVAKLTPNVPNIGDIAKAAEQGGADAICAINTLGPGSHHSHGAPVLSNGLGGMSGKGVLPIALKCVSEIAEAVSCPVIGCGGISSADNVRAFKGAGASIFGIGSALVGMTTEQIGSYFTTLTADLERGTEQAESLVRYDIDMGFDPVTLVKNEKVSADISILTFDKKVGVQAGEFIFLWIPGLGEKPFSALTDDPFSLVVINLGEFTDQLIKLEAGTQAYVRGPHGIPVQPPENAKIMAVSGGTGLAAVYQIARDLGGEGDNKAEIFVGARSADRLYFTDECEEISTLHIATDDGSRGHHGLVTEMLRQRLQALSPEQLDQLYFYNCGPEPMVHAAVAVQKEFCRDEQIHSAIDYLTKCGVGICGACNAPDGRRLCVDGPFLAAG
ncbi:tRNA-dihydrouridine synthase [Oceanicoccus sagamiensis]|uniref:dihydrouracil dehydrogenase (NAD(+)) n=1 Tax=Oceanicoccus sagamiensis TaxID=716816 RepID=A0A1X9NN18_9GAMM|nr:tRNA-dihydrouridine synthase [Oceanicoccus sagamiensis]ARN76167.1 dihydroorotate dehydrogenase [Oceanicoccus sagamiensis]